MDRNTKEKYANLNWLMLQQSRRKNKDEKRIGYVAVAYLFYLKRNQPIHPSTVIKDNGVRILEVVAERLA